jgi:hypothetical protein
MNDFWPGIKSLYCLCLKGCNEIAQLDQLDQLDHVDQGFCKLLFDQLGQAVKAYERELQEFPVPGGRRH